MNRRQFIGLSGTATLAAVVGQSQAAETSASREFYDVRKYVVEKESQKKRLDAFFKEAAIPALNRLGIKPVGVFYERELASGQTVSNVYTLVPLRSPEALAAINERLAGDSDFLSAGAEYIDSTAGDPAFKRQESSLLVAFRGMPKLEQPVKNEGRVFQLRIYESPSEKTGLKKIEMFEDAGEIRIFREVGLNPVFFGRAVAGAKMPNLTYMLGFKNLEEQQAAWKRFGGHPDWKRLKEMPEYADKSILCGITNISLVPASYSQI